MSGFVGIVVGIIIVAVGLGGLGVALAQMMTHADPNGTLISLGGLAVFAASIVVLSGRRRADARHGAYRMSRPVTANGAARLARMSTPA